MMRRARPAIREGHCFGLELKALGGHPTELQLATIAAMEAAGAYCCIDEGLNCALPVPETWGLLRGHAITADKSLSR
jgi:hypothetical protein